MYRRLLIPVSQPAEVEPLIRFGAQLLDAGGEIRVLHVIHATSLPEVTREWRASVNLMIPAHEAGAALDVPVDPEVRASPDLAGEILESAETHAVDGILMTLRGRRSGRIPFVGHTATAILQHADADVLVVNRLALAAQSVSRILVPSFTAATPPKAMRIAEELALHHRAAPIVALTLSAEPLPEARATLAPRSPRGLELRHRHTILPESLLGRRHRLPDMILAAAARERYGFLLLAEDRSRAWGPLLTRRFLEVLFRNAPCPVMAVRG